MNSKYHLYTSILKSVIRISACIVSYLTQSLTVLAGGFLVAEGLGILEELGDKR